MTPFALKTAGYGVSTISVILLGTVAWPAASKSPALTVCLVVGVVASIGGMALRWTSYWKDKGKPGG